LAAVAVVSLATMGAQTAVSHPLKLSAHEKSQIAFVQTYLHPSGGGGKVSYGDAERLVEKYPKIPTMPEAPPLGFGTGEGSSAAAGSHAAGDSGCKAASHSYYADANADVHPFGWSETLDWCFDQLKNIVRPWRTNGQFQSGYPFIAAWASFVWHYTGELTGTGYPKLFVAEDPCGDIEYLEYDQIVSFTAGWGPFSDEAFFRMFTRGYADGSSVGGYF
jgi:hypothetical protein